MKRGYIAALAIAAAVVLVAGALLRPKPHPRTPEPPPQAAPAPVRGSDVRQISDFLTDRARRASAHVVYLPATHTSGVVWPTGQIVTASEASGPVQAAGTSSEPAATPVPPSRLDQTGWIVLAAKTEEGRTITGSGMMGGSSETSCGAGKVRKLLFNFPLDQTFAGAGVFDISGSLLGLVVRCPEGWTAIAHTSVQAMLDQQLGADPVTWQVFGVRIAAPDALERKTLKLPAGGLFVTEVRRTSRAASIGILPGDLLLRTGTTLLHQAEELRSLTEPLIVWRSGRQISLELEPLWSLDRTRETATLTAVQPGTRLHAAGLRAGDRILTPSPERLIASKTPAWVIFERDDRRMGALLR